MGKSQLILLVDDEPESQELLKQVLEEQYLVLIASDGEEGLQLARQKRPNLVLLDITMPKLDGMQVCEALRSHEATREIPVIMLTGTGDFGNRVKSFKMGADDFIQKPFLIEELLARVESKLRRFEERGGNAKTLECGNLVLDLKQLAGTIDAQELELSLLEFNLLKLFVQHKGEVMSRDRIYEAVWTKTQEGPTRTVDTHIVALRKKIAAFDHSISTVYGAGYVLKKRKAGT